MGVPHHNEKSSLKKTRSRNSVRFDGSVNVAALQGAIEWIGSVRIDLLNETKECMLAEIEWPKKSGNKCFGCATTGLIFDKQSGRCHQSSNVTLLVNSVVEHKCTSSQYQKWHAKNVLLERKNIVLGKPGPKPKGYVDPEYCYDAMD